LEVSSGTMRRHRLGTTKPCRFHRCVKLQYNPIGISGWFQRAAPPVVTSNWQRSGCGNEPAQTEWRSLADQTCPLSGHRLAGLYAQSLSEPAATCMAGGTYAPHGDGEKGDFCFNEVGVSVSWRVAKCKILHHDSQAQHAVHHHLPSAQSRGSEGWAQG
jgi:hypothetical protein